MSRICAARWHRDSHYPTRSRDSTGVETKGLVFDGGIEGMRGALRPRATRLGTDLELCLMPDQYCEGFRGRPGAEVRARFCIFARTGADGSYAGLWRDDGGETRVVHFGSGSGSTLVGLLGERPVDFLRLVAIGYDELCWDEQWKAPPRWREEPDMPTPGPDRAFQQWVRATFDVDIPTTACEIVPEPCHFDDDDPADPFARWLNTLSEQKG